MPLLAGIHIGSEYSVLAIHQQDNEQWTTDIIANEDGDRQIPSYVLFGHDTLAGTVAKSQSVRNSRQIAQGFRDATLLDNEDQLHPNMARLHRVEYVDGQLVYNLQSVSEEGEMEEFQKTAFDGLVAFLDSLKLTVESNVGATIDGCVITVASQNLNKRAIQKLKDACGKANLDLWSVIPEPVAIWAAQLKDVDSMTFSGADSNVVVIDIGGWSAKVSVLAVRSGIPTIVSQAASTELCGIGMDNLVAKHFQQEFAKKYRGLDMSDDKKAQRKLKKSVEQVKITLSNAQSASMTIESLFEGMDFTCTLHRGRFELLCDPLFRLLPSLIEEAVTKSKISLSDVYPENVLLAGGCVKIPKVQEIIQGMFPAVQISKTYDSQSVFALGCVVEAQHLFEEQQYKRMTTDFEHDVTDFKLLARCSNKDVVLVPENHPLPLVRVFEPQFSLENDQWLSFVAVSSGKESVIGELKVKGATTEMEFRLTVKIDKQICIELQELSSKASQLITI